jgi:hypothetical protein
MNRITLCDNAKSAVIKMCEGNPGAITALMEILKCAKQVDPDDFMGGLGKILALDTLEIYGTNIYVLWNDICDKNTSKMIAVLRANQLGFISDQILKDACHRQDRSGREIIPVEELYVKVVERFPRFDLVNR